MRSGPFLLVFVISGALVAAGQEDGIRCSNGAFQHDCPNSAPVCCFAEDGSPAGCCGVGFLCNDQGGCKPAGPLPPNYTSVAEHDITEDVHMSIARIIEIAAVLVCVLIIAFIAVFAGLTFKRYRAELHQRKALLEAMPSSSDSDSEVSSQSEARLEAELAAQPPPVRDPAVPESRLMRCMKCRRTGVNCLFLDCEHTVTCTSCAARLKRCPECKRVIKKRKKLFVVA
jgi:hypothetical protein